MIAEGCKTAKGHVQEAGKPGYAFYYLIYFERGAL